MRLSYLGEHAREMETWLPSQSSALSKGDSAFRTWLYRVVANHLLNMKQRAAEQRSLTFAKLGAAVSIFLRRFGPQHRCTHDVPGSKPRIHRPKRRTKMAPLRTKWVRVRRPTELCRFSRDHVPLEGIYRKSTTKALGIPASTIRRARLIHSPQRSRMPASAVAATTSHVAEMASGLGMTSADHAGATARIPDHRCHASFRDPLTGAATS